MSFSFVIFSIMCFLAPQAKIELKPLVKTLNFINEKTPSIPSGMVANRYLGLRGDLNIAMWITFIQSPS
ncbi:uncharacterized protein OCT59_027269 [Rhizophagus irregularis]|uniref:uncharacterized protein n=1 Tax=Rhizophagus irregularis TaxID=588596 RepID=UPI00331A31BA|nr:hypothetical protein OCT59_027269 [Rhizophagus irregularis]